MLANIVSVNYVRVIFFPHHWCVCDILCSLLMQRDYCTSVNNIALILCVSSCTCDSFF